MFCKKSLPDKQLTVKLTQKGCDSILNASKIREDSLSVVVGQTVHVECRKIYTNPRVIELDKKRSADVAQLSTSSTMNLRSSDQCFVFKEHCLFCGYGDSSQGRQDTRNLIPVRTIDFSKKILDACEQYEGAWVDDVKRRVLSVHDLHAADAVYHNLCSTNFRTGKKVPKIFQSSSDQKSKRAKTSDRSGRPKQLSSQEAFLKVVEYLEKNDDEQRTIRDLVDKMEEYCQGKSKAYGFTHMKNELKQHYGEQIVIAEIEGRSNVVTLRNNASTILQEFHLKSQDKSCNEESEIINTAARLIKHDIKKIIPMKHMYPAASEIASIEDNLAFIPESLKSLLSLIFVGNEPNKIASIGQAIVQAARPRALLAPLQLGLAVQMHSFFDSRFLIDSLHAHGFCSSYAEVTRFQRSSAAEQGTDFPEYLPGHFHQYVADNADHDIATIDGRNTFHGMAIIAAVTPTMRKDKKIPRKDVHLKEIVSLGKIRICPYISETEARSTLLYGRLNNPKAKESFLMSDLLWKVSPLTRTPRPLWNGYMQMIAQGQHPGKSSIIFLPMIDLNPNDLTCIYSTLNFVCDHAKKYNTTPVITFDQPLWWKAYTMIKNEPEDSLLRSIVLRLGGFHTEMSYLGCVGHLMSGSGLQELLQVVYAQNSVEHMLSGKALARAVRGHLLVDSALNMLLTARAYKVDLDAISENTSDSVVESQLQYENVERATDECNRDSSSDACQASLPDDFMLLDTLLAELLSRQRSATDVETNQTLQRIFDKLEAEKLLLKKNRTASLWLQYMQMIDILRRFIKAERTGNWELHLQSLFDMLPFLAACGHNLYTKSVYIYLQNMMDLKTEKPDIYQHFVNSLHVVRRSDRFWAGLSTDLVIEQVFMRSLKSTGGMTRGRGMSEAQRSLWVLSSPSCAEMNDAMQQYTSVQYVSSEQHRDTTQARLDRDNQDTAALIGFLRSRNPFTGEDDLHSITTGVTAPASVNVDIAADVGKSILDSMEGKMVYEFVFRRKTQVITMDVKSKLVIGDEIVQIDPNLLFQRLLTAGTRCDDLPKIMSYELSTYPTALFDSKTMIKVANKSTLLDAMWDANLQNPGPSEERQYILDGGALLHRIPWTRGNTWDEILQIYTQYVSRRYGKAIVVFDGYSTNPSTKDCAHLRRTNGLLGTTVHFSTEMRVQGKKEEILANKENKRRFLNMLGERLEQTGCQVIHAAGDADLLMVQRTVVSAARCDSILVGDDTDLLVLLCYHGKDTIHNLFFRPEPKSNKKKASRSWNIKSTRERLGETVSNHLPFIHAVLGCDTTSRLHGLGKRAALNKMKDKNFVNQAEIFMKNNMARDRIIAAGERAAVLLYKGADGESMDGLRYKRFCEKTTTSTSSVEPHSIPPTSAALKYHSLRVYYQVQEWLGVDTLDPKEWGWKVCEERMVPLTTDLEPAPRELLEIIKCSCRTGCSNLRCSCRKNGLPCTFGCGECKGVCSNISNIDLDECSEERID